ncbi:voltage-dependent T-type calcium channel subunit alpha-1H-like [Melanotaenia boesemani]|uniref:voltage-dependent T-type calcium channel subunit alpha-1H-like n=1 Tax=Melanotaenia boesemani TaxID=1250792 RepID=UPI001C04550D|nr:voltage-dependent T-type calcium channel subunit alpha-1H-like [Melanotaenia boesemani]
MLEMTSVLLSFKCQTDACLIVSDQVFEAIVFMYFLVEMLIKVAALSAYGHRTSYLACKWHRLDVMVLLGELLDFFPIPSGIHLAIGHSLKPLRLINRVPSIKLLLSVIVDTLPMLGHVLLLFIFVIHIFGVVGVHLWGGELHNRCFLGEDIVTMYNLSLSPYFDYVPGERDSFVCSRHSSTGARHCKDVPPYREGGNVCTLAAPHQDKPGNWGVTATAGPSHGDCVNWNLFYNVCRPDGPNPNMGSVNFDNIVYAWITVFQVITLEGWTDVMYLVMDTHSIWSIIPFILMTALGSFILMNISSVVIASHFIDAVKKGRKKVQGSVINFKVRFYKVIKLLARFVKSLIRWPSWTDEESWGNLSLCITKPNSLIFQLEYSPGLLGKIKLMVEGNFFQHTISVLIVLNIIGMAVDHHDQPQEMARALGVCNLIVTVLFAIEMILKVLAFKLWYFVDRTNLFDFTMVIISVSEEWSQTKSGLSVLRVFRVLRFVKLLRFMPNLKKQLNVLWKTMKDASTLCWLMLFFIFIFSVMGMHLFGCKMNWLPQYGEVVDDRKNFDSLLWSMVTVFQIVTQEDWNLVLYNAMASTSLWAALYFIAIIVLGKIVLLNLLVGMVVENFHNEHSSPSSENESLFASSNSSQSIPDDDPETIIHSDPTSELGSIDATSNILEEDSSASDTNLDNSSLNLIQRGQRWCTKYKDWTLYIVSPKNKFRILCQHAVSHQYFDNIIVFFIVLSCITITMERPDIDPEERLILDVAYYFVSFVGFLEMFMKVTAFGMIFGDTSYFRSPWNMMDGLLVIVSVIQILISSVVHEQHEILSILRILRVLRAVLPLRMVKLFLKLKLAMEALTASLKPVLNVLLICFVFFFFYGILGMQLFKGKFFYCVGEDLSNIVNKSDCLAANYQWERKAYNFDSLLQAMFTLFVMYTKDGWVNIMYDGLDAVGVDQQPIKNYNKWILPYFLSFMVMSFLLLDMFIGVIVDTFHDCHLNQKQEDEELRNEEHLIESQGTEGESPECEQTASFDGSWMWQLLYKICTSRALEFSVTVILIINVLLMGIEHYNQPEVINKVTDYSNYVFMIIMITEVLLKLVVFGVMKFIKDCWNLLDIIIILLFVISFVLTQLRMTNIISFNPSILRFCKILRLSQVLKNKMIRTLIKTLNTTLHQIWSIFLLFLFFLFVYAALGVELFGKLECSPDYPCLGLHRNSNFQNFPMAMLTLYKVCTGDNWSGILKDTMRKCRSDGIKCQSFLVWVSPLYFSTFVILAQFVLANLIIALIMQVLQDCEEEVETDLLGQEMFLSPEDNAEISTLGQRDDQSTPPDSISL